MTGRSPEGAAPADDLGADDSRLRALGLAPGQHARPSAGAIGADADDVDQVDQFDRPDQDDVGPEPFADTPMWLSHHWPHQYDRCVSVAGLHVCRRCLVLYPLALVAGVAVSLGSWWDHAWDPWVLWLFPLPGVIEFVLDNLGLIAYRPRRQVVLSAAGALAAGLGYVRYLDDTTDPLAWSVLAVYTAVCLSAAVTGGLLRRRRPPVAGVSK